MTSTFLAIVSVLVMATVVGVFVWDIITRRWDSMSWRNLFLLGFAHFFGLGSWYVSQGYRSPGVPLQGPGLTLLALATLLFMGGFMASGWFFYRRAWVTKLLPKVELPITSPGVVGAVLVLLAIAILGATIVQLSYAAVLVAFLRGQLAATAVGLATYFFIARRFNPVAWTLFLGTILTAILIGVVGSSGRRMLLGSFLAVPWMWYFTVWRYRAAAPNFARVGAGLLLGFFAVLAYTPIRFEHVGKMGTGATISSRTGQLLDLIQHPLEAINPEVIKGLIYTDAAPNTIFIIETYPEQFQYVPFAGLYWMAANPIPRSWWPGKPEALGLRIQLQMHAPSNLGPGIVGHGWSEGGFLGVLGYAVGFGFLAAMFDRALAERSWNPYFVAVIGSNLGNVFGLARGDTPLFLLEFFSGVVVSMLILYLVKWFYGPVASAFPPIWVGLPGVSPHDPHDPEDPEDLEDPHEHGPASEIDPEGHENWRHDPAASG